MISIITGDIINSRHAENPGTWLSVLKQALDTIGPSPRCWELYRGDSFQLELEKPEDTLYTLLRLKSAIKSLKGLDVRMAAGIGDKSYTAARVSESNGTAFVYSGELLEQLKKEKVSLSLRSDWPEFDAEMNLYLRFALIAIDNWTTATAELVYLQLSRPGLAQQETGQLLGISQSSVSERQSRSNITDLLALDEHFRARILKFINAPS